MSPFGLALRDSHRFSRILGRGGTMPERRRSASALHPALGRADQGDHVHRKRSRNAFQCPQGRDLRAPIASPRFLACRFSYGSEIKLVTKVTPDEAPPRGIIANVWSHRLLT